MKEIDGIEVEYLAASVIVKELKSIENARALSRWAKIVEDNTSYKFERKANQSRIYTNEDLERFKAVDNEYIRKSSVPIAAILTAHFSVLDNDKNEIQSVGGTDYSLTSNQQKELLNSLITANKQLLERNTELESKIDNITNKLTNIQNMLEEKSDEKKEEVHKQRGFFSRIFKK